MPICGTYRITGLKQEEIEQCEKEYNDNVPAPLRVNHEQATDGSWTVVAIFPPCPDNVEHSPERATGAKPPNLLLAQRIVKFFEAYGWTKEQSIGILANIEAESGFNPSAVGDNGLAFGLCQWHSDRQTKFMEVFGHSMQGSTLGEQMAFVDYELRKGGERKAGQLLSGVQSPEQAAEVVSEYYERPRDKEKSKADRAKIAPKWAKALSSGQ